MTITRWDKIALLPKRCDKCNRLFWLEGYKVRTIMVGIEDYPLEWIICRECADGERKGGSKNEKDAL